MGAKRYTGEYAGTVISTGYRDPDFHEHPYAVNNSHIFHGWHAHGLGSKPHDHFDLDTRTYIGTKFYPDTRTD